MPQPSKAVPSMRAADLLADVLLSAAEREEAPPAPGWGTVDVRLAGVPSLPAPAMPRIVPAGTRPLGAIAAVRSARDGQRASPGAAGTTHCLPAGTRITKL